MANLGIRTDASGTFGALTLGGVDKVTVGNNGIQAGSYAPNSITATELAAGALIENSPLNGIGYGPGAGGTVTQATSKSTAVTLNKPCGKITMHPASLSATTAVGFLCNNSIVSRNDIVSLSIDRTTVSDAGNYQLRWAVNDGTIAIVLVNVLGVALADGVGINFAVIKGAIS